MGRKVENNLMEDFKNAISIFNQINIFDQAFHDSDLIDNALAECRMIMEKYPSSAEPYFLMGLIAFKLEDQGQAIAMCELAHKMEPDVRDYAEVLSVLMIKTGKIADGLYFSKLIPSLNPHPYLSNALPKELTDLKMAFNSMKPSLHYAEACRLFNLGDYQKSIKECSAELRLNQKHFDAYNLLGRTLIITGGFSQSTGALQAAAMLTPTSGLPRAMLARALVNLGDFAQAIAVAEHALRLAPTDPETYAQAMDALLQCPGYPLEKAKKLALNFHTTFIKDNQPEEPDKILNEPDSPVRIGLMSNSFFLNSHSQKFTSWFTAEQDNNVHFQGYQQSVLQDTVTTNAKKACHKWREIYDADPFTLAITMRAEELDVLVDLSGTSWPSRMDVMGLNPSPCRVGTFCLPEPGFAPGITHILSDSVLSSGDEMAALPNQKTIVINGTLFARPPYLALSNDIVMPAEKKQFITFGGILDLVHLSPECAVLWSELLSAVPNSKLFLCGNNTNIETVKRKVCEYFSHVGLLDRIVFPKQIDFDENLPIELAEANIPNSHWAEIDIFLDTYPFNCSSEICEALWTGAPVITLTSERRNGLIGASILTAANRMQWIAKSHDEFINIGIEMTKDLNNLKEERDRLQKNIVKTILFDHIGLVEEIRGQLYELAMNAREHKGKTA